MVFFHGFITADKHYNCNLKRAIVDSNEYRSFQSVKDFRGTLMCFESFLQSESA